MRCAVSFLLSAFRSLAVAFCVGGCFQLCSGANITNLYTGQQLYTGMQLTSVPSAAVASFSPTQVSNAVLYLSYLDLPANAFPAGWTNELGSQVFTNKGTTYPTNSSLGVYFDGSSGNYMLNGNSGIRWSNVVDSVWVCITMRSFNHVFDVILGRADGAGTGLAGSSTYTCLVLDSRSSQCTGTIALNNQYDVAIQSGATSTIYTNGILSVTNFGTSNGGTPNTVWGIGRDNNSDNNANCYIKFILVCSNYVFTATDITNLHNYAISH